jgi:hypothetical protein
MESKELPAWLWLWFPPLLLVLRLALRATDPELFSAWFGSKEGPEEWATVFVLVPGIVCGFLALRQWRLLPSTLTRWWLAVALLGACYFCGEEVSWGQKVGKWETPPALAEVNRQDETNLHNISSLFNEKPRLGLELWVLAGGIVVPLRRRRGRGPPSAATDPRAWFWPTLVCVPTALLAIAVRIPDRLEDFGVTALHARGMHLSELQEYYFALFLALYLASFRIRLARLASAEVAAQPAQLAA